MFSFLFVPIALSQLISHGAHTFVMGRSVVEIEADQGTTLQQTAARSHQDVPASAASGIASADTISDWFSGDHAGHARWLVHAADYAVVSTHSTMREGWPFSHVVSISDGAAGNSTGRIILYVATISQFAADVEADSKVSVGVSQAQANGGQGCQYVDAEWPLCARVSVFGHAKVVPEEEQADAADIMFARHAQMRSWAALMHKWAFYEVHITDVRIVDFFGGFQKVSPEEYFAAAPQEPLAQRQ
eukprot:jgi/Ulvmu1/8543/UM044_0077.1